LYVSHSNLDQNVIDFLEAFPTAKDLMFLLEVRAPHKTRLLNIPRTVTKLSIHALYDMSAMLALF
jgi:hypothetical protein